MFKSVFDNLGVIRKMKIWATTFILGMGSLVIEKSGRKTRFFAKIRVPGWVKKFKKMLSS
jgi:hypothetical protein